MFEQSGCGIGTKLHLLQAEYRCASQIRCDEAIKITTESIPFEMQKSSKPEMTDAY
jgi:hypothetical protein